MEKELLKLTLTYRVNGLEVLKTDREVITGYLYQFDLPPSPKVIHAEVEISLERWEGKDSAGAGAKLT